MVDISIYIINSERGLSLSQDFYNLGLRKKYEVVDEFISMGLLEDYKFYDKIVKALLQHSSNELKKNYPVRGVRKIRKEAKLADEVDLISG